MQSAVIVRSTESGDIEYYVAGTDVRFFIIDERSPDDRVYEWLSRDDAQTIIDLIGDSKIGSSQDERHEAIKAKILNGGKTKLEVVKP